MLHVRTLGQGKDLILLHGWGTTGRIWEVILDRLTPYFRVHCVDLPGFGSSSFFSEKNKTIDLVTFADHIAQKLDFPAIWMGWSLGGLIATQIAIRNPNQVERLITVASSPKFLGDDEWPGMTKETLKKFGVDIKNNYSGTLRRFFQTQFHGVSDARQYVKQIEMLLLHDPKPSQIALEQGLYFLECTDLRDQLSKIQCPCLHVFGRLDVLVPHQMSLNLKKIVPGHQMALLPKATHIPFLTATSDFIKTISDFIDTTP